MSSKQNQKVIDDTDSEESDWEALADLAESALPIAEAALPIEEAEQEAEETEEKEEKIIPVADIDERYMFESFKTADTAKLGAKIIDLRPGHKSAGKSKLAMAGDSRARSNEQKKKRYYRYT